MGAINRRAIQSGMNDFYSVLKQSIIDRGLSSPESREGAYAQARRAMINRLWAYDPPLAEDEIDHRIGQFDIAVAQIEADVVEAFATMAAEADSADEDDADLAEDGPAPSFGGTAVAESHEDEADDDPDLGRVPPAIQTLDERSLAIERALSGADELHAEAEPGETAAQDGDAEDWPDPDTGYDDDPPLAPDDDAFAAEDEPDGPAPTEAKPEAAARLAVPSAAAIWNRVSAPFSADHPSILHVLIGVVAVLGLVLVGALVWLVLPSPPPPEPVVLETSVPGGVSDPDTAIRLPKEAIAVTNSFSLFDGRDPTVFAGDPDNPVRFDGEHMRIATSASSPGAKVIIGAGLSSRLAGRTVRVTIEARAARENGATSMRFAYESGVALSHWQTANLSSDFTELGLVWRVPALRTSPTGDYIVIEPGIPGSGTAVEIRSVRIDMVE